MAVNIKLGDENLNLDTNSNIEFYRIIGIIKNRIIGRKYLPNHKCYYIPFNYQNYLTLREFFPEDKKDEYDNYFEQAFKRLNSLNFLRQYQKDTVRDIFKGKKLISTPTGSGKTLIALAYVYAFNFDKVLFIVPSPLREQWQKEAKHFFNIDMEIIPKEKKKRESFITELVHRQSFHLITNYEQIRLMQRELTNINFNMLLLDEAQFIKNSKTQTYKSLKTLHSDNTILMTATPMINSPMDVFNIVNFSHPKYFDYWTFTRNYINYKEIYTRKFGTIQVPDSYKNLDTLNDELEPIMVRKDKNEIMSELPEKITQTYWVKPTQEQKRIINYYRSLPKQYGLDSDDIDEITEQNKQVLLATITMMRRVADSPETLNYSKSDLAIQPRNNYSPKIDTIKDTILPTLEGKTIIFTEYADFAYLLTNALINDNHNVYSTYNVKDIDNLLEKFKNDQESKILITTDRLNYGVNLQFAQNVIHADLPWSPARVEQREGRVHRIGQNKNTLFISVLTEGTIEEQVYHVLTTKNDMFKEAIDGLEIIKQVFGNGKKGTT